MSEAAELHVFYGGTFDPVHNGHLAIACAARDALGVDITFLPAADPPHRPAPGASAVDRVAMLQLAIAGMPGLRLDLREIDQYARDDSRRSWSIDTLRALRAELGSKVSIAWLLGADSFTGLPGWKCWRELSELTHFVVAERTGSELGQALAPELAQMLDGRWVDDVAALRGAPAGLVLRLRQPLHPYSATAIRHRIQSGIPWRHMLPVAVAEYIVAENLYGSAQTAPYGT
ncbi:MAG: nicotinate-nucleotide adenylyltransferase [Luteimonas sp.]